VPRQPDPTLEQRILDVASRLWARGGEKALTMRAVAKAAGTTTPTVYERYRDRAGILRALRMQARQDLFAAISHTHSLSEAVQCYLEFALENSYCYEVLFDSVARPPVLYEPWPTFSLMRERVAKRVGGSAREHTRLMIALWALMHGTVILIIRGRFEGVLRDQAVHACMDAFDVLIEGVARAKGLPNTGPKWPANLILGEGKQSHAGNGKEGGHKRRRSKRR
jgi:AcrR family transcriptional regulator